MRVPKTTASPARSKQAGKEYGIDLWTQMLMERRPMTEVDGPWAGEADARREARKQGFDPDAFAEGAKKEWLAAQRDWRRER